MIGVVCALIAATLLLLWWPRLVHRESAGVPSLRWEQLTNFNDSAEIPALSRDGKLVAFLRGPGSFGVSTSTGQIWLKSLPDGESFPLTKTPMRKQTISLSPDGGQIYFRKLKVHLAGTRTNCRCWEGKNRSCLWPTRRD